MLTTSTFFQAPNTIIFDHVDGTAHSKEIVIAEKWGYRLVWCATFYNTGEVLTNLYRVEQLRKLDADDRRYYGAYASYGVYDTCMSGISYCIYYDKSYALSIFAEKVKIAEHNRYTELDRRLERELESINYFFQGPDNYCNDCSLLALFGGSKFFMLRSLETCTFKDVEGFNYGLDHTESNQWSDYEEPVNGVYCSVCNSEIVEPMEQYDDDESVTGFIAGDSVGTMGDYDSQLPSDFDSQAI